jgi:DNA-binding response OmpR family regulator
MTAVMTKDQQILMIGWSTPLMEGVYDLLQVVGYPVQMTSSWAAAANTMYDSLPALVIVDLSNADPDALQLAEQIRSTPRWSTVPILFLSFSGDDHIRDLQRQSRQNGDGRLHFYAHTLLSMDELLYKVRTCIA